MANDHDLVVAVQALDTEFTTQYVEDQIDATTGDGSAGNTAKRAMKRYFLLKRVNSLKRDGLLEAVKGQTLLNHIKNKDYVQSEIDNFNDFPVAHSTRLIPLTCVQTIIDIFTVMAKRGGSSKVSFQALCTPPDPSSDSFPTFEKRLLDAKAHLLALGPTSAEHVADIMIATQLQVFITKDAAEGSQSCRDAFRTVHDDVEQELDKGGQFVIGPLSLSQMQDFGANLQLALQNRGLPDVPLRSKIPPTSSPI
jgi:hypothetical protein